MTDDKPEPPDMRGDRDTLMQKIQDEIHRLVTLKDDAGDYSEECWCNGRIESLEQVRRWLDEQEIGT